MSAPVELERRFLTWLKRCQIDSGSWNCKKCCLNWNGLFSGLSRRMSMLIWAMFWTVKIYYTKQANRERKGEWHTRLKIWALIAGARFFLSHILQIFHLYLFQSARWVCICLFTCNQFLLLKKLPNVSIHSLVVVSYEGILNFACWGHLGICKGKIHQVRITWPLLKSPIIMHSQEDSKDVRHFIFMSMFLITGPLVISFHTL